MEVITPTEQLLFTTTRIETVTSGGAQGTGTGFIFTYNISTGEAPFVITNKHVIAGAKSGKLTFSQAKDGKPDLGIGWSIQADDFESFWFGHQDPEIDVAVAPLAPFLGLANQNNVQLFYKTVPQSLIPSEDAANSFDALEEIVFVGYPNGIWDNKNLLPIIRRGTTATPISIDFQGKKLFLIDASVFPGSSGSPVFLLNTGMYFDKKTSSTNIGSRLFFLGIVAAVYFREDHNEIKLVPAPTVDIPIAISKQMINLGIVFKASTIIETIQAFLTVKGIV
jgi:Trypsin-like peptidase domain